MLWDPGSVDKDEEEEHGNVPFTPILVPLQNKPLTAQKGVPVLVPDVQDLKDQFQQQQNMLTQIKETLIQNESQLSSKGKQMEVYANKLSEIRTRSKNSQGKKTSSTPGPASPKLQKKLSKESLAKSSDKSPGSSSKSIKGKVSELKKCLEENKIKFEQRTGKEQSETKKIESLVEQLKLQLTERDRRIQDLQKTIEEPTPKAEPQARHRQKLKESVASKMTQTTGNRPIDDSNEIIELQNKILGLEANVLDLEENLKEKESVIEARTQAVTLLSQDLSLKGKNTLESLEETRQEMRTMQNTFIAIEDQLKKDLLDRNNRLATLEEKYKELESTNVELSVRNAEQQEKLVDLQRKYLEVEAERESAKEWMVQGHADDKLDELTKKISALTKELDERNKAMIKMKIEHKKKMKNMNKTLESLKGVSQEKAEIVRLSTLLEELEIVKTGLENRVAELEDEKASEKRLKEEMKDLELMIEKQSEELSARMRRITDLEREKVDLVESKEEERVLGENLYEGVEEAGERGGGRSEDEWKELKELRGRMESMEEEYKRRVEELKGEHRKEIEMLESYYNAKGESLDRRALEEYRISAEMSNIHVEEQIELLVREKQQLLEKLKSLSGVSSTDSLTFEKMEHSDLKDYGEMGVPLGEAVEIEGQENGGFRLEKIVSELEKRVAEEKEKVGRYEKRIWELESAMRGLEEANDSLKQQLEASEVTEPGKNSKTSTNTKNRIRKIEMELRQSKQTVEEQNDKLEELRAKLEEKEELMKKYSERIEMFEKDEWERENQWKSAEDEMESVQELQKKCLSLENSLFELSEDCERLRKENIEVVHLLSEEKVKRRKLLEEVEGRAERRDAGTQLGEGRGLEERIRAMSEVLEELEGKVERLEVSRGDGWGEEVRDLQEKLEWTNVVLTSKETEMFGLQNLLEDRNRAIEILETDLKELREKLEGKEKAAEDIGKELRAKEAQLEELSANFERLQESVKATNEKTATNESQLRELLSTVREMEGDVFRKETELEEIKGILEEKNLDMSSLRNRLEEVNSDLTYSYQEHLENMGKCLRDKESEYEAVVSEKIEVEERNRKLVEEREEICKREVEIRREKEGVEMLLLEKERAMEELKEQLKMVEKANEEKKSGGQEKEDLKIKLKKLAANLKKKAQNEAELTQKIKELEESLLEKEKEVERLESEVKEVREKWTVEESEKEKVGRELCAALADKAAAETRESGMRERVAGLEKALEEAKLLHENQVSELKRQSEELNEDKGKIFQLEGKVAELSAVCAGWGSKEEERQRLLEEVEEARGKYEEMKLKCEELVVEKGGVEGRLEEVQKALEESLSEKASLEAKTEERLAVIEGLETELRKVGDRLKAVEEKFFHAEDRRLSLESKNEEMREKLMENSENLSAIDDLSVRIDELLKSEKCLQNAVRELQCGNAELKQALDGLVTEKYNLERELKASSEKLLETGAELRELRSADEEKAGEIRELREAVERLKTEKKQLSSELDRLNRDYEQFEVDLKENLENWHGVEKSLRQKIEELEKEKEKAGLSEKCGAEEGEEGGEKTRKKLKSVTFRTDETEYIKELKEQVHGYEESLRRAREEVESLREELLRERVRGGVRGGVREEVSMVVAEAEGAVESLTGGEGGEERAFDGRAFFGEGEGEGEGEEFLAGKRLEGLQSVELDSLVWDDGWGAEGNLEAEYLSGKEVERGKVEEGARVEALEAELRSAVGEKEKLKKELEGQTAKYGKALRKLKEVKAGYDRLQSEAKKWKGGGGFGDLDAAIVDELKCQIESMEAKEKELMKNLENAKLEKESLLKRIEVLNAGNEKFLEMKERQDNEVEIWQRKNNELLKEIAELRGARSEARPLDDRALLTENQELRNKVEALEWKNCELRELLEEKEELLEGRALMNESSMDKVMKEKSELQKEIEELNNVRERLEKKLSDEEEKNSMTIGELNDQLTALAAENETLQDILGEMKKSADAAKKQEESQESKIFDYFKASPATDLFSIPPHTPDPDPDPDHGTQHRAQVEALALRLSEVESVVSEREEELEKRRKEMEGLRERLLEAEKAVRVREEEVSRMAAQQEGERRRFAEAEREKEGMIECLRRSVSEVEAEVGGKCREKELEVEVLKERVAEKEEELSGMRRRVSELEKSYNDSKVEIERLLNEEKLNVEEKFVEPFQKDMKIPVAFEVEALSRTLDEEKQKTENLLFELSEKEKVVAAAGAEVEHLRGKLAEVEKEWRESKKAESAHKELQEESVRAIGQLEKMVSELQEEVDSSKLLLSVAQRELEELQTVKDEAVGSLERRILELESKVEEAKEREETEVSGWRNELAQKTRYYEALMRERREKWEVETMEVVRELEQSKRELEKEVEELKGKLEEKERETERLCRRVEEEGKKVGEVREALEVREREVTDLRETLRHLQEEIGHFRNFEKQVRDLRVSQIREGGSGVPVTDEGHPDLSDWTEHELAELSSRLQSDLDTALYMLHQRDVRCDELTFELMQLLEERDTLQLRLSTALRINEGLKAVAKPEGSSSAHGPQETKDLVDQSNDRQQEKPVEDLQQLASKISELHSVSYLRDKTVKDESVQRHKEQMNLLSRVSDSDITLSRDFESSPAVLLNWMRGKTTPKVMHI